MLQCFVETINVEKPFLNIINNDNTHFYLEGFQVPKVVERGWSNKWS